MRTKPSSKETPTVIAHAIRMTDSAAPGRFWLRRSGMNLGRLASAPNTATVVRMTAAEVTLKNRPASSVETPRDTTTDCRKTRPP